jgi:hypothetical protein
MSEVFIALIITILSAVFAAIGVATASDCSASDIAQVRKTFFRK